MCIANTVCRKRLGDWGGSISIAAGDDDFGPRGGISDPSCSISGTALAGGDADGREELGGVERLGEEGTDGGFRFVGDLVVGDVAAHRDDGQVGAAPVEVADGAIDDDEAVALAALVAVEWGGGRAGRDSMRDGPGGGMAIGGGGP